MLPTPLSKIKQNFCYCMSLFPGLFKILNFFPPSIQCWKIFPGTWDGDECLYFSIVFAVWLLSLLTALCTLCYTFLHWRPRPFPIFPLYFSFVWFAMSTILRAPEGSVVLKASVLSALPGYFLGTRRLNLICWMLFTDLLEWLKS